MCDVYTFFDKIKYVLIQYFMWTLKNHNIYNIYLFAKKKKIKKNKNIDNIYNNIHCKLKEIY